MEYSKLTKKLKQQNNRKIIVAGPQRSGGKFITFCIAKDLNIKFIKDKKYKSHDFDLFYQIINTEEKFAIHAPAMVEKLLLIPNNIIIIFTIRNINDIILSQKRIKWKEEKFEKQKFEPWRKIINLNQPISKIKYDFLEKVLLKQSKNLIYELEYKSLSIHPLWIEEKERKNFKKRQIFK